MPPERSVGELLFGDQEPDGPEDVIEVHLPGDERTHAMRRVHTAQNLADAYIVKDALEAQGFAATVRGEHLAAERAGDVEGLPSVWVPESQAERAFRLVTEHEGVPDGAAPDWTCPGCDEEIEGQFTECWQCGTARPDASSA